MNILFSATVVSIRYLLSASLINCFTECVIIGARFSCLKSDRLERPFYFGLFREVFTVSIIDNIVLYILYNYCDKCYVTFVC